MDFKQLISDIEPDAKARQKSDEPKYYLIFDKSKVSIDGKTYQLNKEGIEILEKALGTRNRKLMAKRLLALLIRLAKSK